MEHRPGLAANGDKRTISFESLDYPGYFLRHFGNEIFLENSMSPRNNTTFDADATFRIHTNFFHVVSPELIEPAKNVTFK